MPITERQIDQAFSDNRKIHGGVREDYFGLLYLKQEFGLPTEEAAVQTAFGGNDYGFDGFHLDPQRRNLYLFQFKWSTSHALFKQSFQRLIAAGMERVFGNVTQDQQQNQMLLQLRSRLHNDQALIDRVLIHFVFNGDQDEADRSQVLQKLIEDLEGKKYLIDQYFKRPVTMSFEFRSAQTKRVSPLVHQRVTHTYPLHVDDTIQRSGPNDEFMTIGFVKLVDLHAMYREMNQRFFERNIRAGLAAEEAPNRAIEQSLKQIVLQGDEDPSVFAFNHNGVTIFAEKLEELEGRFQITEPRLLNGAQTITAFDRFLKSNEGNQRLHDQNVRLESLTVLCKIITKASPEFVVAVTINNNRQNPVMPWNLRANDTIQLELQDALRQELGIYYERQENAFANLTREDLEDLEIKDYKAIELFRLAQTFLVSDGEIDKLSRMREVFESDKIYGQVFSPGRLQTDARHIVLCYKAQFRLNRLIREIIDKGINKYAYMRRARNLLWALLCQGILNDNHLEEYAERFGRSLVVEADYTEWLANLSSTRARFLISGVVEKAPYAEMIAEERYGFLRATSVYDKCMELAHSKWKWVQRKLK